MQVPIISISNRCVYVSEYIYICLYSLAKICIPILSMLLEDFEQIYKENIIIEI